jgi:hypothetical protein
MPTLRPHVVASALVLPLAAPLGVRAESAATELCDGEKGQPKDPTAHKGEGKNGESTPENKPAPDKPADKPAGDQTGKS